jgi:hypothetical protein
MIKKLIKNSEFDIDVYQKKLHVFWNKEDYLKVSSYTLGYEDSVEDTVGCVQALDNQDGGTQYLIGIFDNNLATLAHESVHVAMNLCNDLGIKVDTDNQEPFCYLVDYIFRECEKKKPK